MDTVKNYVPQIVWDYAPLAVATIGGIWTLSEIGKRSAAHFSNRRMLNRWKESPKDVVIIHTIARGVTVPNCSPFVVKLETYLRMANIPYQLDNVYPFSSKGKTPWITLNGEHYTDSQLIIQLLAKKFEKKLGTYNDEQRAYGRAIQIMVDEYLYWGLTLWRYVHDDGKNLHKLFAYPPWAIRTFRKGAKGRVKTNSWGQGIGRHTEEEVIEIMKENLRALSLILGNKKFIMGDEACETDCTLFGMLSQYLWCAPDSPYEKMLNEELTNLKEYCIRMKETFWPDWEKCLAVTV